MKKTLTIFLWLCAMGLYAQAPERMSYQAVLRDGSNTLLTGKAVGMRISILQGNIFGASVYVETQTATTNANGLVTVEIGAGTPVVGTFSGVNWSNGPYFIKTETDPNGGSNYTITGTTQLLSVPYALHAKKADGVGNVKLDDLSDVSASSPATNQVLSWNGSAWSPITLSGGSGSYFAGTGMNLNSTTFSAQTTSALWNANQLQGRNLSTASPSTGQYLQWDGSSWTPASVSGGGSYTAGTGLNLSGTTFSAQTSTALWNANQLQGFGLSTATPSNGQVLQWNGSVWAPANVNAQWTSSGQHIYYTNGRVGIGTTSPGHLLHVSGDAILSSGINYFGTLYNINGGVTTANIYEGIRVNITSGGDGANTGVHGFVTGTTSNFNIGIRGSSTGSTFLNRGTQGVASGTGTFNQGIFGRSDGAGDNTSGSINVGVNGYSTNNAYTNIGVQGLADYTGSNTNYGIYGIASNGGTNYAGYFSGNVTVTGTFANPSDQMLKTEIQPLATALSKIIGLSVKSYQYNSPLSSLQLPGGLQYGFLAQDMEKFFPELVKQQKHVYVHPEGGKTESLDYKAINYIGLIPVLTRALQEQQVQIEELRKQVELLSKQINK